MPNSDLMTRLNNHETVLGLCNMLPCDTLIERLGAGWDFVWIDMQHGLHDFRSVASAVRTADMKGLASIVRPYSHDPGVLCKVADLSPTGVMIPMVHDADQADQIVRAIRFAPRGARSYGGRRVIDLNGREYYKLPQPLILPQIETPQSVENASAIAAVDGVDGLFIGLDDMKIAMELPIDTALLDNDALKQTVEQVGQAARSSNRFAGAIATTHEAMTFMERHGYHMIVANADIGLYATAADSALAAMKKPAPSDDSSTNVY
jgi:4-hydroxy-2-oxoheptanedioate aldolase